MIRCTIVETTSQIDVAPTRTARATICESLTLGRGAACKIYLPDPRVRLEHARMDRAEDGYLYVQGQGGPIQVDGIPQEKIRIAIGQKIDIGPFNFEVAQLTHGPEVTQVLVSLNFTRRAVDVSTDAKTHPSGGLRTSWINVRTLSWTAVVFAALFLLSIPIWQAFQPVSKGGYAQSGQLDVLWNPGPIASAHQPIGNQCKDCHQRPFQRVTDAACTHCHQHTGPHIADQPNLQTHAFSDQRCATCHREHQGIDGMKKVSAQGCEDCHASVKTHAPNTTLPNVGDFGRQHPDFRLTMRVANEPSATVRRTQTPALREDSGLKFPHDIHLSAKGIKSPSGPSATGGRVVLECASCHQLDSAKLRYQPIRMDRDCAGCHRLGFDAQYPNRQVPHATPTKVRESLRDMFSALALERHPTQVVTVNSLLQSPQTQSVPSATTDAVHWVNKKVAVAAETLFAKPKATCKACHTIEPAPGGGAVDAPPWNVAPVFSTTHWLPKNRFSHAQHANGTCQTCHAASVSKTSADILIPTIETCRNCHVGTDASDLRVARGDKVASSCSNCHGFHTPVTHPSFLTAQKPREVGSAPNLGSAP